MKGLRRGPAVPLILIAFTLLTLVLHEVGYLQPAEDIVLRVVTPVQRWLSNRAGGIGEMVQTLRDLRTLRDEITGLRQENEALVIENVQLREAEAENQRLRELLDFASTIDLGEKHGVGQGMPVVTERGLVGRITEVHETSSEVLLITDVNSAVTALVQTSRATGVVRGLAGGDLLLDQIRQDVEVHEGGIVITSGLGGNLPKNLVIGQISEVIQRDYEMFQQARVRPTVDFRNLEHVLVITNFTPYNRLESLPGETEQAGS